MHVAVAQRFPVFVTDAPDVTKVPPFSEKTCPPTWVTPAPVTAESIGTGSVADGAGHVTPAHGSAVDSVRPTEVR